MLLHSSLSPVATRPARIQQVPPGQHHTVVLKQGSRKIYLICRDVTIGEVREYYVNQVGAAGVDQMEVAITSSKGTKTYGPDEAASFPVTTAVKVIEFRAPAPAKG